MTEQVNYINECTECGSCWYDDGGAAFRVKPWERSEPDGWIIEPVLCDDCFRVTSLPVKPVKPIDQTDLTLRLSS